VAIEIAPTSAECIRRNLAAEVAAGRVVVYPQGVWDREDSLVLNVDDTNFAANSVVMHSDSVARSVRVPLINIDRIVAELNLPRVDFIKMDIEGAEIPALRGRPRDARALQAPSGDCGRAQAGRPVHHPGGGERGARGLPDGVRPVRGSGRARAAGRPVLLLTQQHLGLVKRALNRSSEKRCHSWRECARPWAARWRR